MSLRKKIEQFVEKTYTDRKTGETFLSAVLALGAVGVFFCLLWFALLVKKGLPLWCIIFDVAIIAFCGWAVVKMIIPWTKEAFEHLEKLDENENKRV
jgi:hypothetical protein